jgi:hypothetical protein
MVVNKREDAKQFVDGERIGGRARFWLARGRAPAILAGPKAGVAANQAPAEPPAPAGSQSRASRIGGESKILQRKKYCPKRCQYYPDSVSALACCSSSIRKT